jgi:hypothetical protein
MHYKTPLSHNGYMKSLTIYENYITLSCVEKNKNFYNIILTQNHTWHIAQSDLNNYLVQATIKEQHHSVTCSV